MKSFIGMVLLSASLSVLSGCASSGDKFESRLAPPDAFNPHLQLYQQYPGQKVMVVAVDPTGQWAFGFDHSRSTLEEAAKNAAVKCDKAREKHQVFNRGKLFSINDEIVYYKQK